MAKKTSLQNNFGIMISVFSYFDMSRNECLVLIGLKLYHYKGHTNVIEGKKIKLMAVCGNHEITANMDKGGEEGRVDCNHWLIDLLCLMPLSAVFQLYHGDQF
jgi:hypothetical protein